MFGNLKDMAGMVSQVKNTQKEMKKLQKELANTKFESEIADGMIKATVNGEFHLLDLFIDPSILEEKDTKILATLIKKCVEQAQKQVKEKEKGQFSGLNLPNIPGLF